jgi:peptide/nickel transport system substrate-binding protein
MVDEWQKHEAFPGTGLLRRSLLKRGAVAIAGGALVSVIGGRARSDEAKGTVKVVPEVDLKALDPVWTTALITGTHALLVYDTLFAPDRQQRVHPQMVEKFARDEDGVTWRFELRDGLGWHDGTAVTARDCVASIRRWAARSTSGKVMMERAERLDAINGKSFVLKFKEPFGLVPETMGRSLAFTMREKDAETDPYTQIKTAIGSGPFMFLLAEWQPGAHVVYRRNPYYRPRAEPADGYAGGKVAKVECVECVEWTIIPDPATATAALIAGEMDYLTTPVTDNLPPMRADPNVAIGVLDPLGWQFHIRMNSLAKPFDNAKARQGLQMLVESQQDAYLAATGMTGELGKVCLAPFVCGSPNESMIGTERFASYDPDKIKALFREAGYDGAPLVLMDPTDQQNLHMLAQVLNEHMKKVGLNVDLQAMDWSTLVSRRAIKTPPAQDRGAWHIFPTAWPSATMMDPFLNPPLDTSCDGKNWFGWPCDDELARLRLAYIAAKDDAERHQTVEAIQHRFLEAAPYAYAGQYFPPIAYRKDRLRGVIGLAAPVYWNMEKLAG